MSNYVCTHRKLVKVPEMKDKFKYGAFLGLNPFKVARQESKIWVDCGKCHACKLKRRNQWVVRLATQWTDTPRAFWSLFTYDNEHVPAFNELGKKRFSAFIKRFRSYLKYHWNWKGIKYFVSGEYGDKNHRPHFHAIIYNLPPCPYNRKNVCPALKLKMEMLWKQGFVKTKMLSDVNQIYYTCKYAVKGLADHKDSKPCILFSKGLGLNYVKKNIDKYKKDVHNILKPKVPILRVGKFRFNLAICRTFADYIYGRILKFYRFVDYKIECSKFNPMNGHSEANQQKYKYSKYCEEAVKSGNKTWEELDKNVSRNKRNH